MRRTLLVTLAGCLVELSTMLLLGRTESHHEILGVTGALAVLIAVAAGVAGGAVASSTVALTGGMGFFLFVTGSGESARTSATVLSVTVWTLAALLTGHIADALRRQQRAHRMAEEEKADLHARLENGLLPHRPHRLAHYRVATRYVPGERRLGIGGDFFDVVETAGGGLALVVGDVMGHGPDAAALATKLRATWFALVCPGASVDTCVRALEQVFERERTQDDTLATLCLVWIDRAADAAQIVSLGHPPPLLVAAGSVEELRLEPALPLGVEPKNRCAPRLVALAEPWSLLFYTDGLIEGRAAESSRERFGAHRLVQTLRRRAERRRAVDLDEVVDSVLRANGGPLLDDVAVLLVESP
jgi:serine phosphatase RsbU (regulator of sigma subunit)